MDIVFTYRQFPKELVSGEEWGRIQILNVVSTSESLPLSLSLSIHVYSFFPTKLQTFYFVLGCNQFETNLILKEYSTCVSGTEFNTKVLKWL